MVGPREGSTLGADEMEGRGDGRCVGWSFNVWDVGLRVVVGGVEGWVLSLGDTVGFEVGSGFAWFNA